MALRKVDINLKLILDIEKDDLVIDKLRGTITVNNNENFTSKTSKFDDTEQLLTMLTVLMNRWSTTKSRKFTLTQTQWNQLKNFINGI